MASERIVGAFVFPDFWSDPARAKETLASLRECGVNAIMTESDAYELAAIDATHKAGLRFYAGVACFSDHASNFRLLSERPELWPILENGARRPQMEWYVGMSPTDRRRQEEVLANIGVDRADVSRSTGSFSISCAGRCTGKSNSGPAEQRPLDSSFDATTLAKFEEATGALPRADLDTTSAKAAWIRRHRLARMGRFQVQGRDRFRRRGAKRPERSEGRCGARNLCRAGRERPHGAADRPTHRRSRAVGRLGVADALPQHSCCSRRAGSHRRSPMSSTVAGQKTLPVVQADSNRDPAIAADWGPPMSDADWSDTLSEVAGATRHRGPGRVSGHGPDGRREERR